MPKNTSKSKITVSDAPAEADDSVPVKVDSTTEKSETAAEPEVTEVPTIEVKDAPEDVIDLKEPEAINTFLDPETEQAVDDIVATQDEAPEEQPDPPTKKAKKHRLFGWWHKPLVRRVVLLGLFLAIVAGFTVPSSRYFMLNTAGVRSSASVVVLDGSTQQPLKNVEVTLGSLAATTDKEGQAQFKNVRLGSQKLVIEKRAFASKERMVTIGWGSNPLEPQAIKPVGSQYRFNVTDFLSEKPVDKVEAVSGLASALSDEKGVLVLTLEDTAELTQAEVTLEADGYRKETLTINVASTETTDVQLVPGRSHVFISKRSGRYDVYKIDADGKNEEKVLAGSGIERDDLVLVRHASKDFAALVSTRENVRSSSGYLLSTLTLIDVADKSPTKVAQSERIQIIDWIGDRLVYVQIASGASASDPRRHRLMSYDLNSGQSKELASANYFNDVLAINGTIFYAPSGMYQTGQPALYKINADGGAKQTALGEEVWNIFRTDYDKLVLAVNQQWYEYQISSNKATKLGGEPANLETRVYVDSLDRKQSLWIDQRDGEGVLLSYNQAAKSEKVIHQRSGLANPVQWLSNNAIVFRVRTTGETADYVMSLDGGEPKKLKNVTNTAGVDRWYYY